MYRCKQGNRKGEKKLYRCPQKKGLLSLNALARRLLKWCAMKGGKPIRCAYEDFILNLHRSRGRLLLHTYIVALSTSKHTPAPAPLYPLNSSDGEEIIWNPWGVCLLSPIRQDEGPLWTKTHARVHAAHSNIVVIGRKGGVFDVSPVDNNILLSQA